MKTTRAFRTISEAGEELGLQPHVLRFWESKFSDITPIKRGGGRRFYRPEDIEFLRGIKTLLHDEKHPIKDVQKLIAKSGANRIIELGRSVEEASRDRDVSDVTLVPSRIEKPDADGRMPAPVARTVPAAAPTPAPSIPSKPEPASPIAAKPKDLSGLTEALGRLQALKGKWDAFDTSE
jgi:DNA-binding transcriptional MerR regulator